MRLCAPVRAALVAMTLCAAGSATAQSGEQELLDLLAEETALLTQQRVNADYVPGIVTVLDGSQLASLGARSVADAIALVPGLQANRDTAGLPLHFVRGIPFFDSAGGFKVLIDGLTVSQENSGINGSVLLMAIELVERIEVLRGPGSGIWGDYAFVGLINIITRKDTRQAWIAAGNRDASRGGAQWQYRSGDRHLMLGLGSQRSVGRFHPDIPGPDPFADGQRAVDADTLHLDAAWGDFALTGSALRRDFGRAVPPPRFATGERSSVLRLTRRWQFDAGNDLALWLESGDHRISTVAISHHADRLRAGLDLSWRSGIHQWMLRLDHAQNRIEEAIFIPPGPRPQPFVVDDLNQQLSALVVQDSIDISERLTATAGLRYDRHSDIGEHAAPRLATVWRLAEGHTLKAQYAEGLRAPTFQYLYDSNEQPVPIVEFEVAKTWDVGYIYRRASAVGRITVFHSEFDNLRLPPPPYRPGASARANGAELEWEQRIASNWRVISNLSWVDPQDARPSPFTGADSVGYARWIGNLALLGQVSPDWELGLHWNHVGSRDGGTDNDIDGYDLVNVNLSWHPDNTPWSLRAGVRNALDDRIAAAYNFVGRLDQPAWEGRLYELQLHWRFD